MQTYLHTRSRRAPRWSRCSCGRRWVWSGWLSSGSGPVWRSDPWAGDWGTAAPSSSGSGGLLSASRRCPGPPVYFDIQPSPRFRPEAKTQGMKVLASEREKPGSLKILHHQRWDIPCGQRQPLSRERGRCARSVSWCSLHYRGQLPRCTDFPTRPRHCDPNEISFYPSVTPLTPGRGSFPRMDWAVPPSGVTRQRELCSRWVS